MEQQKRVIKLYKAGKLWLTSAIIVGGVMVLGTTASADTISASSSSVNLSTPTTDQNETASVENQTKASDQADIGTNSNNITKADDQNQSVDLNKINQAVKDAKVAGVDVTQTPTQNTNIQGVENPNENEQVVTQQNVDKDDYQKQIDRLNTATEQQKAQDQKYADDKASYDAGVAAGTKTNSDGKTQIATSSAPQALALDKSKPADESDPTGTMTPTKVYSGDGQNGNLKDSSKIWEYSGEELLNKNTVINKTWAKSGTIIVRDNTGALVERTVDLNESFHDFQLQNGNWSDTGNYHDQGIPKVTISSNAIDNVEMWNLNWQTTFWFTYSDNNEIVPISKMTGTNGDPKVYFLSASLSASNYTGPDNPDQWDSENWQSNEKEYVQTNDAKTVVVAANSTIGLGNISNSQNVVNNAPNSQAYMNISDNYHNADDDDPDVYALKEGVSFTDFTTDKPTLFLGSIPTNPTARWWHSNHNMNSDELAFVQEPVKAENVSVDYHLNTISYQKAPVKQVNEIIKYVYESDNMPVTDSSGQALDYNAESIQFVTTTDNSGKNIVWTASGSADVPVIDGETGNISTNGWSKVENNEFKEVINPVVQGYHVVSTTDTENDLSKTTQKIVSKDSQDIVITVVYAKDQGNLVVNYVDESGAVLSPADSSSKDSGETYTTTPKAIDGYDLVPEKTTGDVTGQYPADGETKEVTYVYGQQGQHTTNYVDEDGKTLVPTDTTKGPKDTDYTTTPAEIPGYHLVPDKTTGDETGKYDTGKKTETTYVYAKDQGNLVVNYVDENGNVLSPAEKTTADTNQGYTTTPKSIDGYDLVPEKTTGDVTGQYPADGQTAEVTYIYGQQGQHTTNYVDEDGETLVPTDTTKGPKDTDYTTTPTEIPGYHLVPEKTTGDETGKYDTGKTTDTTYVYAKNQGNLIVNYVDESGNVLSSADSSTKDSGEDYTTEPKSIDGYDLVPSETTGDVTGQYPANGQTKEVTYVYGQQGQHKTNYVDENGNVLVPAEHTQGPKDTNYTTTPAEVPGYHLVPTKTIGDETGKYDTGKTTDTTYVYAKDQGNLVVNYVDENGNVLSPADSSSKDSGEDYTTEPKNIDGYDLVPSKTTGDVTGQYPADGETKEVTYVYGQQGQHTTNYLDEDGKTLVPTDTTKGPKDTDYTTTPTEIPGYHLVPEKTTGDETGKYDTGKTTDTTYVYAKDQGSLVVNYVDENSVVLSPADSSTQDSGEEYTTTPKNIDGYDLVPSKTTGDVTGQYPNDGETKEVTYVYGKQGQHTTNYVDENGNVLVPAEHTQGPKDTNYTTTPAEISGYHVVPEKTIGDETVKYDTGKTTDTTYVYAKDQGNLIVNYVDESGQAIAGKESSTKNSGEDYTTEPKNIDGYDLVPSKTTGDVTGQYPADGETNEVTYVYGQQGQHTTNYVDEAGKTLVPTDTTKGPKDTGYTTTPAEIPGYHLVPEKTTGDETGKYDTDKTTDTTYVYAKDQGTKPEENVVEKNSNQKQDGHEFVLNNNQVMQDKAQSDNLIKKEVPEKSVKQLPKTGEETQPHNTITMILGLALSTLGLTMFDKKRKNK
ncbi:MucBP domain-containing protein [Leuconostoc sp. C2]|uniref:MucBP domain-containing protein n=1 Tax=Leuconostoc sp. (strain C2) TaxID=979982 RepID=UPI00021756BE|nr:MucBP domain-containing protein [Leuconostoc sp. C2]AEJ30707.1 leucine rich repeat domain/ LPXTG-motif cell wall anchor domainprotein [Leuconostoc sp. C2]